MGSWWSNSCESLAIEASEIAYTLEDEKKEQLIASDHQNELDDVNKKNTWYWGLTDKLIERELGHKILTEDEQLN